jgi:hypothetical protein
VEAPLAVVASAASFALAGAAFAAIGSNLAAELLALAYLAGVVAVARLVSIAYAVPLAMAGLLAYDWFRVEPTHPHGFPDSANLVQLAVYIGVAVLVGELAGQCLRRTERSERARSHRRRAGAAAPRRHTCRAAGARGGDLRRGRSGGGRTALGGGRDDAPVRGRPERNRGRVVGLARRPQPL